MKDGDEEILFKLALPLPVSMTAAIGEGVGDAMRRIGWDTFIGPGGVVTARKRWPMNDIHAVDYWYQPEALADVNADRAAWKDSEGYWWPSWYLPREGSSE